MVERQWGKISLKRIWNVLAPVNLAFKTKNSLRTAVAAPYASRAYQGHQKKAMAITELTRLGPIIEATTKAIIIPGMAMKTSVILIITTSITDPCKYPAAKPNIVPIGTAIIITTHPIKRDDRQPNITLLNISRPMASVPNQCAQEGGWFFSG
jgi:hypothetical protein